MTSLVFALPYVPPAPPAPRWVGYEMTWEGADGSTWDLNGSGGVLLLQEGLVGLQMPGYDRYTSTSPATPGARHRGSRAKERAVEWNLLVWTDESSAAWRELDRAFWRSFDPDTPGTWVVRDERGRTLRLECRFVGPDSAATDRDPSKVGWALYQVQLVASNPFWVGESLIAGSWANTAPDPFFDSENGVDGLSIANGSTTEGATATNPGDEPVWIEWEIEGPMASLSLTVDGGEIQIPTLLDGDILVVDTDPAEGTAILNGTEDVSGEVDPWDPRPIPPGRDVPIQIVANGFGKITARLTPRYRRGL